MSTQVNPIADKLVFRKTNHHVGRRISVTPANSKNRHLSYGRIILAGATRSVSFNNGEQETALICLSGRAAVKIARQDFDAAQYDSIYIPRDNQIEVTTASEVDFAEFSADVENVYPLQMVRYADICKDPSLKFTTGVPGQQRHLNICVGKNMEAGRLLIGFTFSEPGNWTSWPPHEHGQMLEEVYMYFNMPAPAYGLQLVYNNTE